jgi:hypothetical protein
MLRNRQKSLGSGPILWHDPSCGKGTGFWSMECEEHVYRSGSLMTVARELGKYKLHLVGVRRLGGTKKGL